jgi:hypothetical protein
MHGAVRTVASQQGFRQRHKVHDLVHQQPVWVDRDGSFSTQSVEMSGKTLLFKSIRVQKGENRRDLSGDLTLTQAADLFTSPIVVAENR